MDTRKLDAQVLTNGVELLMENEQEDRMMLIGRMYDLPSCEATAAELVKRWNAYPELVEALRDTLRVLVTPSGLQDKGKGRTEQQQAAFDRARAILSKINLS